jgi:hypothetical protein
MNNPRAWHRLDWCRYVLTASLALDYEVAEGGWSGQEKTCRKYSEQKENDRGNLAP